MLHFYRFVFLALFLTPSLVFSQQATIRGTVTNAKTGETLPGVNITVSQTEGVISDVNGNYVIKVNPGKVKLTYSFVGFADGFRHFEVKAGDVINENVPLSEESMVIEGVVVSAGKFEQKLSDVTISMSVLKPQMIENQNANEVTEALNKVPGLDITDGQPSIRGGSGYSYGAGSRVLLMVDDMPILTPDAGDAKWNFIPVENISQIEVLKGASSALFGSSALNGVINVRTSYPGAKPVTKFSVNSGIYLNPRRKELMWWGSDRPGFTGMNLMHSQKFGQLDLIVAGNGYLKRSFRESDGETHGRINFNIRYRNKKIEGLSYGVNGNFMFQDKTDFFLWQNADSGAYRQNPDAVSVNKGYRFNIDPFITMFNKKGGRHTVKTRYFIATNYFKEDPDKNNNADMIFAEYQYHKKHKEWFDYTLGVLGTYGKSNAPLFGSHFSVNASAYAQLDFRFWKKLGISLGARLEYYRIDTAETESTYALYFTDDTLSLPVWPVFRLGLNYQLFKYTFLRASFGQGYRFPTIAEKFIKASIGGLNLFPNKLLKPETGWNAEIGVKQGVKLGKWNGYLDLAGFWTEYSNMMEFTFGIWKPDTAQYATLDDLGFKSINVGHARITGFDFTFTGQGRFFTLPATLLIGYTYTNPVDLVDDSTYIANKSTSDNILKYRYYHSVKGDFDLSFGRFTAGITYCYTSNMVNIDKTFEQPLIPGLPDTEILPGLKAYREEHNKGYSVLDVRIGFTPTETSHFGLLVKNILNNEYMTRPGYIEAPRNVALQYSITF
jgi:iron complex outermembrane receptor protein